MINQKGTNMRVTVTRKFTIDWDGTPEDYIRLANEVEGPLDSLDLGDATGAFVDYCSRSGGAESLMWHSNILQVDFEDELFQYDPPQDDIILNAEDI